MTQMQTWILTGVAVVALAIAALLATGALTSAQTSTPGATPVPSGSAFKSNEDQTHESGESADREAQEDSGQFSPGHGGGHGHGSNEDPTHESSENPEREAQEGTGTPATTAPGA